jgi:hypothetical protein
MFRPIYQWIDTTAISQFLQASTYTFPVTEVFHLIGLTILLGAAFVVCLRLLGFGLQQPAAQIYRGIWAWSWTGLILVFGTGLILLIAEPIKLSNNSAFPYKLAFLAAGLALHFLAYLVLLKPGRAEAFPGLSKIVAILILTCWFGAGVAGRAIGFV